MFSTFRRRVWHLLNRRRFERDLLEEMRDHRARLDDPTAFGDAHRWLEQSRDAWGWNWLDDAVQDFRQGARMLRRSPAFALTGTLILAFGIGLNLTFYQITSVVLIRPRPVRSPDTLVALFRHAPTFQSPGWPYAMADAISREHTGLASVLMQSGAQVHWGDPATMLVDAQFVSTNWFEEFGYAAALGRVFTPQLDGRIEGPPPVVVSHAFWRRQLQSDPNIVGKPRTSIVAPSPSSASRPPISRRSSSATPSSGFRSSAATISIRRLIFCARGAHQARRSLAGCVQGSLWPTHARACAASWRRWRRRVRAMWPKASGSS
jgi:hypothetical protein